MTDRFIGSIKPNPSKRVEISDTERVGLRFRMSSKGNASWIYQKKIKGGKRRGNKLGTYPNTTLAEARSAALELQIKAERGIDVVEEAKESKKLIESQKLVKDVLDIYIKTHIDQELKVGQSRDGRKRQLITYLKPFFSKYLTEISRSELQSIIDTKQAEGKVVMANRICAAIRAFVGWSHRRGYIENDVSSALQKAGKEKSRDRTPSLEEVKAIWLASLKMGDLWGPYIRLCIL
ncbi:Arm DNA-binding domain-containing protein, partial [SAR116 cluster bacterium]|nr:Arm DNA-binding domain-containing protein [SAR116 cluster bacterium]